MKELKDLLPTDLTINPIFTFNAGDIDTLISSFMSLAVNRFVDSWRALGMMNELVKVDDLLTNHNFSPITFYFSNTLHHPELLSFQGMITFKETNPESIWYEVHLGKEYRISIIDFPELENDKRYKVYDYVFNRHEIVTVKIAIPNDAEARDYEDEAIDNIENVTEWEVEHTEWELDDYYLQGEDLTKDQAIGQDVLNEESIENDEY